MSKKEISRENIDGKYFLITYENGFVSREYLTTYETNKQIESDFTYHKPEPDMVQRFEEIREEAKKLAKLIAKACPPSRNRSSALTQLQISVMFANASIAQEND